MFLAVYGREAQWTHYKVLYPLAIKGIRDYLNNCHAGYFTKSTVSDLNWQYPLVKEPIFSF